MLKHQGREKHLKALIAIFLLLLSNYAFGINISLIGSDSRVELLESWAHQNNLQTQVKNDSLILKFKNKNLVISTPLKNSDLIKTADLIYKSDAAFLVSNAADGMMPQEREHILVSRQAHTKILGGIITQGNYKSFFDSLFNQELFDMQMNEMQWLLSSYEMGGKQTPVYLEEKPKQSLNGLSGYGLKDILKKVKTISPKQKKTYETQNTRIAYAHFYLLSNVETMHHSINMTRPIQLKLWSEGTTTNVLATPKVKADSGGNAQAIIQAKTRFKTGIGSRNFILYKNKLVGIGVVTHIY